MIYYSYTVYERRYICMAEFREIKIEDREWVNSVLERTNRDSLEKNFTTIFIWQKAYNVKISVLCGGEFYTTMSGGKAFSLPCGKGDLKAALEEILDYCRERGIKPEFYSLTDWGKEKLEELYPGKFYFEEYRNGEDYVYEAERLRTLSGKKLSAKRNHINRFLENNPDWVYEEINRGNIDEVFEMNNEWCKSMECENKVGLAAESCAVREAFAHFFELGLSGGLIRAGGRIVAYSMGDKLSDDTFLVHIEKAFSDVQGAYPMINREFVRHNCDGYQFVNREDDVGDEGLRKAKLSYQPCKLITKWWARWKND